MDENMNNEEDLVFYYNREKRLERYSENKKLYDGSMVMKGGFFSVLVNSSGGKYMLLSILFLVAVIIIFGLSSIEGNFASAKGISAQLDAFQYEENTYAICVLKENTDFSGEEELSINFSAFDGEKNLLDSGDFSEIYDGSEKKIQTHWTNSEIRVIMVEVGMEGESFSLSTFVKGIK